MSNKLNLATLLEKKVSSSEVYQGNFLRLNKDQVQLTNGQLTSREYLLHPGAAVIIPIENDGSVWLEYQFRYPIQQVVLEFPAGKLDANEQPLACAKRELKEETGISAARWAYAGKLYPAIGYSNEIIHIFFAQHLQHGNNQLDTGEQVELVNLTVARLLQMCQQGEVTDAKTLTCCLWLQNYLAGKWDLTWCNDNN